MREWIWREWRIELPDDWEMLQYSRAKARGNCAWADRYRFRLELNWKEVAGPPDFDRMLSDYQQKLQEEEDARNFRQLRQGQWLGFEAELTMGKSCRFGRHFPEFGRLLELVFLAGAEDPAPMPQILQSIRHVPLVDERQQWKAFGLELSSTAGLDLDLCTVQPAVAQMSFQDGRKAHRIEDFERYGMIEEWFQIPLTEWMKAKDPPELMDVQRLRPHVARHEILAVRGRLPALQFPKFGRRINYYDGAAWRCPQDGRLYYVGLIGPEPSPNPWGRRLCCCEDLRRGIHV